MGNTPTHHSVEDDSSGVEESTTGTPVRTRVVGAVSAVVGSVRRQLSVFSSLDFADAFQVEEDEYGARAETTDVPATRSAQPPVPTSPTTRSSMALPKRDTPLTRPVRNTGGTNQPDLEAAEEDGDLSIYYPERSDATITSDTWNRVEP